MYVSVCACGVSAKCFPQPYIVLLDTCSHCKHSHCTNHQCAYIVHTCSSSCLWDTLAFLDGISSMLVYTYILNWWNVIGQGYCGPLYTGHTVQWACVLTSGVASRQRAPFVRSPWIPQLRPNEATAVGEQVASCCLGPPAGIPLEAY